MGFVIVVPNLKAKSALRLHVSFLFPWQLSNFCYRNYVEKKSKWVILAVILLRFIWNTCWKQPLGMPWVVYCTQALRPSLWLFFNQHSLPQSQEKKTILSFESLCLCFTPWNFIWHHLSLWNFASMQHKACINTSIFIIW